MNSNKGEIIHKKYFEKSPLDLLRLVNDAIIFYKNEDEGYYRPKNIEDWCYEWDFKEYNSNIYSHGFHQYPAKFIPQLARKLLRVFTIEQSVILDNFMGSGTTLIEGMLLNRKEVIGIELNPFACFMAKVKTTPIAPEILNNYFYIIKNQYNQINSYKLQNFNNIRFWFKDKQIEDLSKLKECIVSINDNRIRDFFLLCMSEVIRKVSLTYHNGFKLHRDKNKLTEDFTPDTFFYFENVCKRNIALMRDFYNKVKDTQTSIKIIYGDSCKKQNIEKESVDFILTSPPYGDSRTTVAYGQFSRLSWQWIENDTGICKLDETLLGGKVTNKRRDILEFSKTLKLQYNNINLIDCKRANEVLSFYADLFKAINNAYYYLKKGKYFVLVTGNRTVKNVFLRTDLIITELADAIGFKTEKILYRNIINKRMPVKNSPSNKKGEVINTMLKENIIFLRKL